MSEAWSLLVMVAAVGAGLVTVTVSSVLVRSRQTALFRYFLIQVLLFNLLILGGLVVHYVDLQGQVPGGKPHPAILAGLLVVLAALKLGWLYAFSATVLLLPERELPTWFRRPLPTVLAVFFGVWAGIVAIGMSAGFVDLVAALLVLVELAFLGAAGIACVASLLQGRELPAGSRRRSVMFLGGLYLGVIVIMTVSLVVGWFGSWGQTRGQLMLHGAIMVIYNLLPLFWILRFQPMGPVSEGHGIERYGLSPRELEIAALIASGCTNREIADRLHISLATVKDHNYNIFRKTGVRNRVELTILNLEAGGGQESSGSAP